MDTQRILVTGGLGYIGSHTVVELLRAGYDVHIVDNLSRSRIEMLDRIVRISGRQPAFYRLELTDSDAVKEFFEQQKPFDGIIHFAALKSVIESVQNPLMYYENNIVALLHLLREAGEHSVRFFVFSSSCTVYGQPDELPVNELAPFKEASSPYGETKQMSEHILRSIVSDNGLHAISLRYFNPIGAHESALIGEWPTVVPDNLVPYLTQTAAGLREKLRVYGNDYNTADGTAVRDYIHVCDLAEAHMFALRYATENPEKKYDIFNLGTGSGYTVLEVIHSFERVNGITIPFEFTSRRPGDVERVFADPTKAQSVLGWNPKRTLDDMTRTAWLWQVELMKTIK